MRRRLGKGGVIINVESMDAIMPFAKDLNGKHGFRVDAIVQEA